MKTAALANPYKTSSNQARNVIARFGGPYELAKALASLENPDYTRDPSQIYRWMYPKARGGTDGMIPTSAIAAVKAAARYVGLLLSSEELQP